MSRRPKRQNRKPSRVDAETVWSHAERRACVWSACMRVARRPTFEEIEDACLWALAPTSCVEDRDLRILCLEEALEWICQDVDRLLQRAQEIYSFATADTDFSSPAATPERPAAHA